MKRLVLFLEEPSIKAMFEQILPRFIPDVFVQYVVFQGKQDLEKRLTMRLQHWLEPNVAFMVIRDQDSNDCYDVKARLQERCHAAGKHDVLVRVVCRELESWYLGDLNAVSKAFNQPKIAKQQVKAKFRQPDLLGNPKEELKKLVPDYQQIDGSRRIGREMDLTNNLSASFGFTLSGIKKLVERDAQ